MDWKERLASESLPTLEQRARNADRIAREQSGTPRAEEAERLLALISAERASRALPGNIISFLEKYPEGFGDTAYLKNERADKVAASEACQRWLSIDAFDAPEADTNASALIEVAARLVNMTNLIQGRFEKPKLLDAIRQPKNQQPFIAALRDLLHGEGAASARLERFSDHLHTIGLRKWTYGTYFLFLHDPENCMFVKPEGMKKAVAISGHPVEYDSTPTAAIYEQILGFARWIRMQLRAEGNPKLDPGDMIDVQSFVWHMAPTGKFSRD